MHHADAARDRLGRVMDRDALAVDADLAGVGRDEPVEDVHQRRLARAVLAQEGVDLASSHGQRDVVVRQRPRLESLCDPAHLQNRRRLAHRLLK